MAGGELTPDEVRDELLALAVGHLIIIWAQIDGVTSAITQILFRFLGGHPSEPTVPRAFNRKATYVGKCYASKPELAPLNGEMAAILAEANRLVTDRNTIAHGALLDEAPGSITLMRLDQMDGKTLDVREYTVESVTALLTESTALLSRLVASARQLDPFLPKDLVSKSGSKLAEEFVRRFPPVDFPDE